MITDMIRGEIKVNCIDDIKGVYLHLLRLPSRQFNVVKINNGLDSDVPHLCLNFIWDNQIMGELIIRYGHKPP